MSLAVVNRSTTIPRREWVLSSFRNIASHERKDAYSIEYNDLQEKVIRPRRNIWGRKVNREVMLSVSPEKAAEDYLKSATIYVQRMVILLALPSSVSSGVSGGVSTPTLARISAPVPISSDQELEEAAKSAGEPKESSCVA